MQLCSLRGCKEKGKIRVKPVLREHPAASRLDFTERHEIFRICQVHYQSVLESSAVESGLDDTLQSNGYPLPALRILRRRLEGINFNPGVLDDVFAFLKVKVKSFTEFEKECFLVIDELSIVEGEQFDIVTQSFIGKATIPLAKSKNEVNATHTLVFMLVRIVRKAWNVGLRCNGMASDMGGPNGTLWKLMKIKATRKGQVCNSITHPCDPNRKFWIMADVPHLLKNIVQNFRNHDVITFDDTIVKAYNLEGNTVQCKDILDLFEVQKDDQLKLASKLKSHVLDFEKMNVPESTNLIGSNVSTGLYFLYTQLEPKDRVGNTYLTTAWFCQILTKWFKVMTARHSSLGIHPKNYEETHDLLTELIEIMKHSKFGRDGKWKPFQRGFIVSTTSVLELSKFLLEKKGFEFVLSGRLLQDCVENLFSVVRSGNPKRNALQIRDSIKEISISEYISPPIRHSSYQWSDQEFLSDFLSIVQEAKSKDDQENVKMMEIDKNDVDIDLSTVAISKVVINTRERNILYKVACYILYKITSSKVKMHCMTCLSYCRLPISEQHASYSKLARQPNFQYKTNKNTIHINHEVYSYFVQMEKFFRCAQPILSKKHKYNLGKLISTKILDLGIKIDIPNCHSLLKTITTRFVAFRLKNSGTSRERKRRIDLSSRTMN